MKADCGVCGIPATCELYVCDGYAVPRCASHGLMPAYQAENRLEAAESRCKGLVEALGGLVGALDTAEQLAAGGEPQEANVNRVLTAAVSEARTALKEGSK